MTRRGPTGRGRLLLALFALSLAATGAVLSPWPSIARAGLLPPVAPVGIPDTYSMKHDRPTTIPAPGVLANDLDLIGGTTAIKTANPTHGTVDLRSNGGFTYTPNAGYLGTDVFRYKPSGLLGVATTVTITITNAAPTAANDTYSAVTGVEIQIAAAGVLGNDGDADGDALTANLVDGGGNGSLDLNPDGSFTFKSGGSFTGARTFTYKASDGLASSPTRIVTINVSAPAATPTPPPTPPPTPAPTAPPTPAPTPRPTPTPRPLPSLPLPSLPLPTLPLPTLPLPTLPLPTLPLPTLPLPSISIPPLPGASATPTPTVGPGGSPPPGATATPGSSSGANPSPTSSASGAPSVGGNPPPGGAGPGSGGGVPPGDERGFTVGFSGFGPIDGLVDVDVVGFDAFLEWAVPALVLSVPGLLLLIAVLAQMAGGLLWLPMVRRWLGGFGFRKRRSAVSEAH